MALNFWKPVNPTDYFDNLALSDNFTQIENEFASIEPGTPVEFASAAEATAGTATDKAMSPANVLTAIQNMALGTLGALSNTRISSFDSTKNALKKLQGQIDDGVRLEFGAYTGTGSTLEGWDNPNIINVSFGITAVLIVLANRRTSAPYPTSTAINLIIAGSDIRQDDSTPIAEIVPGGFSVGVAPDGTGPNVEGAIYHYIAIGRRYSQ